jgi:hypothetical protein
MQQANGSGAGRRWKAWGCVHRQKTGQNASRRLPHELGGVFWRRRNHPLTRQLSCCPVCGPVCRAKFSSLHASSCKQPQPSPALILQLVGVFSVPAGFSRDRWRRRNHLQLRRLVVCFQRHLQAHDPGPPSAPLAGDFLFQVADKPNRYQGRHQPGRTDRDLGIRREGRQAEPSSDTPVVMPCNLHE